MLSLPPTPPSLSLSLSLSLSSPSSFPYSTKHCSSIDEDNVQKGTFQSYNNIVVDVLKEIEAGSSACCEDHFEATMLIECLDVVPLLDRQCKTIYPNSCACMHASLIICRYGLQDPIPRGEIKIEADTEKFGLELGLSSPAIKEELGLTFTLKTPWRHYWMKALDTESHQSWIEVLSRVIGCGEKVDVEYRLN